MNIDLARTFLEIVETGNFNKAAERLHVTQSTVSMRIRALEDELGRPLFVRSKAGTELTPAGTLFRRYASTLVRVWQQARHELALPPGHSTVLTISGQHTLWDHLLVRWIPWMRAAMPDVALRAEVGTPDAMMRQMTEGLIDIAVMYAPQSRPGLVVEKLFEDRLVLASSVPASRAEFDTAGFVSVDWGPDFAAAFGQAFPDMKAPALSFGLGSLALQTIVDNGGSGYFPIRLLRPHLASGRLHLVDGALDFRRPAFLVHPAAEEQAEWLRTALQGLRYVASLEGEEAQREAPAA